VNAESIDAAVERYESGDTWRDDDGVVQVRVKRPLDKVIPVRLDSRAWETLRREASKKGIGPTTLARMWLLERLQATAGAGR